VTENTSSNDFRSLVARSSISGVHNSVSSAGVTSGQNPMVSTVNIEDNVSSLLQSRDNLAVRGNVTNIVKTQRSNGSPDKEVATNETTVSLEPVVHGRGVGGATINVDSKTSAQGSDGSHQTAGLTNSGRAVTQDLVFPSGITLTEVRERTKDGGEAESSQKKDGNRSGHEMYD